MTTKDNVILSILKDEMKPALGVTEPISVALGAAKAYEAIGGTLKSIRLVLDPMLFKNGVLCKIPGTNDTGFELAAVLCHIHENANREIDKSSKHERRCEKTNAEVAGDAKHEKTSEEED